MSQGSEPREGEPLQARCAESEVSQVWMIIGRHFQSGHDVSQWVAICLNSPRGSGPSGSIRPPQAGQLAAEQGVRNVDWHKGDIHLLPYALRASLSWILRLAPRSWQHQRGLFRGNRRRKARSSALRQIPDIGASRFLTDFLEPGGSTGYSLQKI